MTKKSKRLILIPIGLVILLVVVAASYKFAAGRKKEQASVRRQNITEAIYALGKVKSDKRYEVKVGVMTTLKFLYVREGQRVKAGQQLLKFEDSNTFSAPFDGVVTKISNYPGEIIAPQVPIIRVEDLSKQYIEVSLEQQGALRVRPNQPARIEFEAIRSNPLPGSVGTVYSRDDEFVAHVDIANLPSGILPGMTADVVIEVGTKQNVLVVPITSVQDGQVTVVRSDKTIKIPVEIGAIDGEWAEVLSGDLNESDSVIVK